MPAQIWLATKLQMKVGGVYFSHYVDKSGTHLWTGSQKYKHICGIQLVIPLLIPQNISKKPWVYDPCRAKVAHRFQCSNSFVNTNPCDITETVGTCWINFIIGTCKMLILVLPFLFEALLTPIDSSPRLFIAHCSIGHLPILCVAAICSGSFFWVMKVT